MKTIQKKMINSKRKRKEKYTYHTIIIINKVKIGYFFSNYAVEI